MSDMTWTHKGVVIEMRGEQFVARRNDKAIIKPSLAAVKKEIDKQLDAEAKHVTLALPVVMLKVAEWGYDLPDIIERGTVTGVDERNRVIGIETPPGYQVSLVLPHSEENEALIPKYRHYQVEARRLAELVSGLSVPRQFNEKRTYADCIESLRKACSTGGTA